MSTEPLTDAQRNQRIATDLERLFADQEPVTNAITLAEAMSRALKYNMDHRVKMMEYAVSTRRLDLANMELLPQIIAAAGYVDRSNFSGGSSFSLLTGEESLEPSTSQERKRSLADLTIAWNVLDFGVSYVTTKQRQDEIRIAEERRRKAIQNIMQDVIDAYWRAWSAQELSQEMDDLIEETLQAIERSQRLADKGAQRKSDALDYQRNLLETRSQLWEVREDMVLAKAVLSRLMNLLPGTEYRIASPEKLDMPESFAISIDELERKALADRPELREEDYRLRISQLEVKKAMLRMFPGIQIDTGAHYDSNIFLFNNDWSDISLRISWNLFNVFGGKADKKLREAQVLLADTRRMALSMAVMTQVRLAVQRYQLSLQRYRAAADLAAVNESSLAITMSSDQTQTEFDIIRVRAIALVSKVRKDLAYASVQNAMARVLNSIGVDPLPEEVGSHELISLNKSIGEHWTKLMNTYLKDAAPIHWFGVKATRDPAPEKQNDNSSANFGWSYTRPQKQIINGDVTN